MAVDFRSHVETSHALPPQAQLPARPKIAYYSMEFGANEKLPIYSGGLGVLSGDQLKGASDLKLNFYGVGLGYHHGFFRQQIDETGWQRELYPEVDFDRAQAYPLRDSTGTPIETWFPIENRKVYAQVRKAMVGRVPLYLLDSNLPKNAEIDRWVTGHLYGGDEDTRIRQESALAFGGFNLIPELIRIGEQDREPDLHHMNEGHAAFLALALAHRERLRNPRLTWREAMDKASPQLIFTSHTPVSAGIDSFWAKMVNNLLEIQFTEMGSDSEGRRSFHFFSEAANHVPGAKEGDMWCQLHLGLAAAGATNGVSSENAKVVNNNWGYILMDAKRPQAKGITNGQHTPSWMHPRIRELITDNIDEFSANYHDKDYMQQRLDGRSDGEILAAKRAAKLDLVEEVNRRRRARGEGRLFDPEIYTQAYGRRQTPYKRNDTPMYDLAQLDQLLNDPDRPMQMVISGKAHPRDEQGKILIQRIHRAKTDPRLAGRVELIADYDIAVARLMVRGADGWPNFPRVPLEASGTSGMKAATNGARDLSTETGWTLEHNTDLWDAIAEHYPEDGDGTGCKGCDNGYCKVVAHNYYEATRKQKAGFYGQDSKPTPLWIASMRGNIVEGSVQFGSSRMMNDYDQQMYQPAYAQLQLAS